MGENQRDVEFSSSGTTCRGVLVEASDDSLRTPAGSPLIVLAHGFGGTIDAGLLPYAERFAAAGIHALAFDYRHFGRSDGEPRQLVSIRRQLADWAAAIRFARTLPGVDPQRIALFGTSFSGGHVVAVAAADQRIAAVVSQCPMMDGLAAMKNVSRYARFGQVARMTMAGLADFARALLGFEPRMVPIVGPPGTLAAMTTPDAEPGYLAIAPPGFRNEVCARICLTVAAYRPGLKADRLPCPILICACASDSVAPVEAAKAAAARAGDRAELRVYPIGHFDIYRGEHFERAVSDQIDFLHRHLRAERAAAVADRSATAR
ncbi:MAG: alpha/beta hydrolase [Candidatus Dadabacteria bacterium]|nr:MAG: alpha/beta hydrolase [Candidatus Dadabacteria bacterium]